MSRFNKHLIVVGSARSGTSWLSEIMARQLRYRMLFEPEHEFNTTDGKLICDQWINADNILAEAHTYLGKVFSNTVDSDWIGQLSNRKYKMHLWPLVPKKYIIKFVRANLSAKYMNDVFKIPVIHIIRNPYDVLASQQRVSFPWLFNLDHFKNQSELVKELKKKYNFDILTDVENMSSLEILTVRWCIENVFPLQLDKPYNLKYCVIKHEVLRNDLNEYLKLCAEFNIKPLANILTEYKRPSSKTHPKSVIINEGAKKTEYCSEDLMKINKILDAFNCTLYGRKY